MSRRDVAEEDVMGFITTLLIDQSKFKFSWKSTTTTNDILTQLCEKVGIKQPQYFGFKRLRNLRSSFDEETIPKIWMSEKLPLFAQSCDSSTVLYLRHKYWFYEIDELTDPITVQLIYDETNRKLMTERYKNDEDVAVQLAACRIQLNSGDYQKDTVFITEESIANILPEYIKDTHTIEEWRHLVSVFHEKLKGLPKDQIQKKFLGLAKDNIPGLQVTYFPGQYSTREMKTKVDVLVGVTPEGVGFYTHQGERKRLQVFHSFRELTSWNANPMWNGLEAPDYERPDPANTALELQQFVNGPFRSQLFIKPKSKRTKDIEIELSSFISEDDTILSFIQTYNHRLKQFANLKSLDDDTKDSSIQIRTLEGISKKIRVAADTNGLELISTFAEKIGLKDLSFFQLSSVMEGADKWIAFKDPIVLQGVSSTTPLVLKLRFYWKNPAEVTDPVAKTLYFVQIKDSIVNGDLPVNENDIVELIALDLQYTYGAYDKKKKYGFMSEKSISQYIPYNLLELHNQSWYEKKIIAAHEKISHLPKDEALSKYLLTASTLPNYGMTFFQGIIPKTDEECFVGVSKLGLALYKHSANMDLLASYRFGYELRHYTNDGEAIEIKVKPARHAEDRTVVIVSLRFSEIIDLLSYYEKMRKLDKELNNQE